MKILKIDHLGIAVNSIDEGKNFWSDVLGLEFEGAETVEEQKVTTAFFPVGESEVELLESTAPDGPVAKFIEKKGTGFQHIAFRVADIDAALEELKQKDIQLIDQPPRIGAGGARIAFLHPKATGGILVELGFISNTSDRTVIQTQGATIAQQLAKGVNDYLESVMGGSE